MKLILKPRVQIGNNVTFHDAHAVMLAVQAVTAKHPYRNIEVVLCVCAKIEIALANSEGDHRSIEVDLTANEMNALIDVLRVAAPEHFSRNITTGEYHPPNPGVLYLMMNDITAQLQTEDT